MARVIPDLEWIEGANVGRTPSCSQDGAANSRENHDLVAKERHGRGVSGAYGPINPTPCPGDCGHHPCPLAKRVGRKPFGWRQDAAAAEELSSAAADAAVGGSETLGINTMQHFEMRGRETIEFAVLAIPRQLNLRLVERTEIREQGIGRRDQSDEVGVSRQRRHVIGSAARQGRIEARAGVGGKQDALVMPAVRGHIDQAAVWRPPHGVMDGLGQDARPLPKRPAVTIEPPERLTTSATLKKQSSIRAAGSGLTAT